MWRGPCGFDEWGFLVLHNRWPMAANRCCSQGMLPSIVSRLSEFQFKINEIDIQAVSDLRPHAHPQALHALLQQLQQLQQLQTAAHTVVQLQGLQWTAAMAAAVAAAAPLLQHLQLAVSADQPLTDELLSALLHMSPPVRQVTVGTPLLQSDQHANTPWPWDKLSFIGDTDDVQPAQTANTPCWQPSHHIHKVHMAA